MQFFEQLRDQLLAAMKVRRVFDIKETEAAIRAIARQRRCDADSWFVTANTTEQAMECGRVIE